MLSSIENMNWAIYFKIDWIQVNSTIRLIIIISHNFCKFVKMIFWLEYQFCKTWYKLHLFIDRKTVKPKPAHNNIDNKRLMFYCISVHPSIGEIEPDHQPRDEEDI